MNSTECSFFALLRAGLWNRPADTALFSDATDWDAIFAYSLRQTVLGLVGDGVHTLPATVQPPVPLLNKIRNQLTSIIRTHALINRVLVEVVAMFGQQNIYPVLLKGQGVALNYVDPTRRQCGDIDLYIGMEDYDRACALVCQCYGVDQHAIEIDKHYQFHHQGVVIELHRMAECLPLPWHDRPFQRWSIEHLHGNDLRTIQIQGVSIQLPPVDFDALYIFNHAWHHFSAGKGIGLRQLCDWARYLHTFHDKIDHKALRDHLKEFGLWRAWRIFGCIIVDTLGLPMSEFPFYTNKYAHQGQRILAIIGREGNFGLFDPSRTKSPQGYIVKRLHTFTWMHRRFGLLFRSHSDQVLLAWFCYIYTGLKRAIINK